MKLHPFQSAASFIPPRLTPPALRRAAACCTGCDLYRTATQTVFGEGPRHPSIVFVGEQPGDQEDRMGRPFVGPAGALLNRALAEAGIARDKVYVTNAVKHFKWEPQGKKRKHKRPSAAEVAACRPWLQAEVSVLKPHALVCLGVTAAQSVFAKTVRLSELRGRPWDTALATHVFVTIHPSAILRYPDAAARSEAFGRLVEDLRRIGRFVRNQAA
ncbi:Phage SPO1 DNA polymerase-related protein [Nitrospira japonica]|uniref:Type-4 uracil-DNA glycosylase n=1 Tax=Nitrospira japonica TaxID=1325564 RepID=A0A1W1I4K5_9BACT|nr:UdgX family uracil-DNA binding protein [Nitrospira japonica]SLM47930.1 Phage SPO1 DNA polymerase-related protein [Nitrospira japonica]